MFVKILPILLLLPCLISTEPVELTDKTWKAMLDGEWMVEFYAPWCGACQHFKRTWNDFSNAMLSKNIKVAAVDVVENPSLSARFRISSLPTLFHVRDGVFRQFEGDRSFNGLKNYIDLEDWKTTQPLSSYFGPNSILTSLTSSLFDLSILVKDAYTLLHDQYGVPSWLIYIIFGVGVILLGIILAFSVLTIIDYCITGASKVYENIASKNKKELNKSDAQKLLKPNEQTSTTDSSSTSEETTPEDQDNDLDEEQITTDQTVRRRPLKK